MELIDVNNSIAETVEAITKIGSEVTELRCQRDFKKAEYENELARTLLEQKLLNSEATQTDLKALAASMNYKIRLEYLTINSQYMRKKNELLSLQTKLEGLEEISYNIRKELSTLNYGGGLFNAK
jgi:hypothetical protein